jgi:UDP-N-acetylmuramoylalanine-D-glutamate ligase
VLRETGLGPVVTVEECDDLDQAVRRGFRWARGSGGVVLLSPAAASFGRYRDYRDRAAAFAAAMNGCRAAG